MFKDLYLSIFILGACCFFLGFAIAAWLFQRAKRKEQEAYYAECERDFNRGESRAPDGEPF